MAVAAGMKAASSIFGGSKSARAIRQMRRNLEAQKQVNQDWYDRRYNEDATQRANAMRLLTMTEENAFWLNHTQIKYDKMNIKLKKTRYK